MDVPRFWYATYPFCGIAAPTHYIQFCNIIKNNAEKMKIKVNGKAQEITSSQIGLIELLQQNNVTKPELVSVQLNGSFVRREDYQETIVQENDEVDFLFFMGGGSFLQR